MAIIFGFGRGGNQLQILGMNLKHCVLMPQDDIFEFIVGVLLLTAYKPSKCPCLIMRWGEGLRT